MDRAFVDKQTNSRRRSSDEESGLINFVNDPLMTYLFVMKVKYMPLHWQLYEK